MRDHDARIVGGAVRATALVAPVAVALGALAAGGRGALGAALGMALAAGFFSVTVVAVGVAGLIAPHLMLPAALATYVLKLVLLLVGMLLIGDDPAFDRTAFGLSVVAGTCVYLIAEVRMALRTRIPYVVTDE